jgi:hypothetical protein
VCPQCDDINGVARGRGVADRDHDAVFDRDSDRIDVVPLFGRSVEVRWKRRAIFGRDHDRLGRIRKLRGKMNAGPR